MFSAGKSKLTRGVTIGGVMSELLKKVLTDKEVRDAEKLTVLAASSGAAWPWMG